MLISSAEKTQMLIRLIHALRAATVSNDVQRVGQINRLNDALKAEDVFAWVDVRNFLA